jgi:hypothetical protein
MSLLIYFVYIFSIKNVKERYLAIYKVIIEFFMYFFCKKCLPHVCQLWLVS